MMPSDFVHLHTHCHSSAFDGLGTEEEFAARAAEMGQPALALTDHGSLRGLYAVSVATKKHGIRLIPGLEAYLCDDAEARGITLEEKAGLKAAGYSKGEITARGKEIDKERRERDHITIWALNDNGLRNLYRLNAWAWTEGFYHKPRVDMKRLKQFSDGLAVSSGCPTGVISSPLRAGKTDEAEARAETLADIFGDRFYFEIMPHVLEDDNGLAAKLLRLADGVGARVIVTQDAHYPRKQDAQHQEVFLCIQTRAKMSEQPRSLANPKGRFCFGSGDFWLRTREEMVTAFQERLPTIQRRVVERACDETVAFSERCSVAMPDVPLGKYLVAPPLPTGVASYDDYLLDLVVEGCTDRFRAGPDQLSEGYRDRLLHEVETIQDHGFSAYFITVWDVRKWARESKIFQGPGRGSAAGSLVSYLLRITDLDPVQHGLSFERFMSPGRKDLPDIDLDFESGRREEVVEYLRSTYGEDRVAHISTNNTLGGRSVLRDLARVFEVPEGRVAPVAALIPPTTEEDDEETSAVKVLTETSLGAEFAQSFPDVAQAAARLEGQIRGVGLHAAGVVVASEPLADIVPLETRSRKGGGRVLTVAYDMHGVEASGLVKIDILGLRTLAILSDAFGRSGVKFEEVDLEDLETLAGFETGRFAGVFQFDSSSARRFCRGVKFSKFSDVAVMTALDRPGPIRSGLAGKFLERHADPTKIVPVHPIYDRVLAATYGVPVYQEQIVALAYDLAGYTPEEADKLRKKVAKKLGVADEEDKFLSGCRASGMDLVIAQDIFGSLVGFGQYAFNKSHAYSYAMVAFWCMWLKVHHPGAFYAAALAVEPDREVQHRLAAEARRQGIPVLPPDVQTSSQAVILRQTERGAEIVGSLSDIDHVGPAAVKSILDAAPFTDLGDFYARTAGSRRGVTSRTFGQLAKTDAFRHLYPNGAFLAANYKEVWERLKKGWVPETSPNLPAWTEEEKLRIVGETWPLYVDPTGRGAMDVVEEVVRGACRRTVVTPDSPDLYLGGFKLLFGRASSFRIFASDAGQVGRLIVTSMEGIEIVLRIDPGLLEGAPWLPSATGQCVLVALYVTEEGRTHAEAVWLAKGVETPDPALRAVLDPVPSRPRDPGTAVRNTPEGKAVDLSGSVLRFRHHLDKSGKRMATLGLLGSHGYAKLFSFSSRSDRDLRKLVLGDRISCRVKRLSGLAACLTDAPIIIGG